MFRLQYSRLKVRNTVTNSARGHLEPKYSRKLFQYCRGLVKATWAGTDLNVFPCGDSEAFRWRIRGEENNHETIRSEDITRRSSGTALYSWEANHLSTRTLRSSTDLSRRMRITYAPFPTNSPLMFLPSQEKAKGSPPVAWKSASRRTLSPTML